MFERILEKILVNNLGPYIIGLDKKNLNIGVWSGNIIIQNISLRPDILDILELPIQIKFSFIGKLNIKVPWASLGSRPVEIEIEDVYLIVANMPNNEWAFIDIDSVNKRMKMMENFIKEYLNKVQQKQKSIKEQTQGIKSSLSSSSNDDKGMLAKMTEKIIDNIQLNIKNIHIRYENISQFTKYAIGITLEEILIYTTNEKWEREFIDRTNNNKLLPMNKMLTLKNMGIYWTSNLIEKLADIKNKDQILYNMRGMINKTISTEYIINITAKAFLTSKNINDNNEYTVLPNYELMLTIDPIDINIKKIQIQQVINTLEFFTEYKRFILKKMNEREKKIKELTNEQQLENKEQFKILFNQMMRNEKKDEYNGEEKIRMCLNNQNDIEKFKELLIILPDELLAFVIKDVLKDIEKDTKIKELQIGEAKKKKSVWDYIRIGSSSNNKVEKDYEIDPKELQKLQDYLNEAFSENIDIARIQEESKLSEYQTKFRLKLILKGGNLYLSEIRENTNEEGININYSGLESLVEVTSKGFSVSLKLMSICWALKTKYAGTNSYVTNPVIQRTDYSLTINPDIPWLLLEILINPKDKQEGTYVQIESQPLEIIYRPQIIERLVNFFTLNLKDESLMTEARETFQNAQDKAKSAASEAIQSQANVTKSISISIASPTIVIPFMSNGDLRSECWVLNLGDLKIQTKNDDPIPETQINEIYEILLINTRFQYFQTQILYMNTYKALSGQPDLFRVLSSDDNINNGDNNKSIFNLIDEISIKLSLMIKRNDYEKIEYDHIPKVNINLNIGSILVRLNPSILRKLFKLNNIFDYSSEKNVIDLIETERIKLLNGSFKMGIMYIKQKKFNGEYEWNRYFVIFKGGYLYFFKKQQDQRPYVSYYIKGAKLYEINTDIEKQYSFMLNSRYNQVILGFDEEKVKNDWLKLIETKIEEFSTIRLDTLKESKSINEEKLINETKDVSKNEEWGKLLTMMKMNIESIMLRLHDDYDNVIAEIQKSKFEANYYQEYGTMQLFINLESIEVRDFLSDLKNPHLKNLITSTLPTSSIMNTNQKNPTNTNDKTELIEIHIIQIDRKHPNFNAKKTDLSIEMKFGYLCLNCKPQILNQLIFYFIAPLNDHQKATRQRSMSATQSNTITNPNDPKIIDAGSNDNTSIMTSDDTKVNEIIKKNVDKDNIEIYLKLDFKHVGMRLINQEEENIFMGEISLKDINFELIIKQYSLDINAKLSNLQIWDMTNYPNTMQSNLQWQQIIPYEILGIGNTNKSLLELSFQSIDPVSGLGNRQNRVFKSLKVKLACIRMNYLQQPVLRIIDYFINQVSTIGTGLPAPIQEKINNQQSIDPQNELNLKKEKYKQAMYNLAYPSFFDFEVTVLSPIITLKPLPNSTEYIEVSLGDIKVYNKRSKNQNRLKNKNKIVDFIWSETIYIEFNNACLYKIINDQRHNISQDFNFNLDIEYPLLLDEYNTIYNEIDISLDKRLDINNNTILTGNMTPMIVVLSKSDYALIMKGINFNIAYDDGLDEKFMFKSDNESINIKQNVDNKQDNDVSALKLGLTLQNISLLTVESLNGYILPRAMVNLHLLKIDLDKNKSGDMMINLCANDLNGSYFETGEKPDILIERRIIGRLDNITEYKYGLDTLSLVIKNIHAFTMEIIKQNDMILKYKSQQEGRLNVNIDKKSNDDTNINASLKDFKAYLVTEPLIKLVEFIKLDDTVIAPPTNPQLHSIKSKINEEKHGNINYTSIKIDEKAKEEGLMNVKINIKNIVLMIPSTKTIKDSYSDPQVLALKGDISFDLSTYKKPLLANVLDQFKNKKFVRSRDLIDMNNRTEMMNICLDEVEIFVCDLKELLKTEDFKYVHKRNMILPFTLRFTRMVHNVSNMNKTKLITVINNDIYIDSLIIRLSYQDYVLLFNSIKYQLDQLTLQNQQTTISTSSSALASAKTQLPLSSNPKAQSTQDSQRSLNDLENMKSILMCESIVMAEENKGVDSLETILGLNEDEENNSEALLASLNGMQICIINDVEESLVPVFEFTLYKLNGQLLKLRSSMAINGVLFLSSNFFNPIPSKWEPIIEKFGIDYELMLSNLSNTSPKINLSLNTNQDSFENGVNITISDKMIDIIYYTIQSWSVDFEKKRIDKHIKRKTTLRDEEVIDYISPYSIINETGYPIIIEPDIQDQNILNKKIPKVFKADYGEKINYLVGSKTEKILSHGQEELDNKTNKIKFKINHNKLTIPTITNIDIDKVRMVQYEFNAYEKDNKFKPFEQSTTSIICNLKMINTKKVMIISSTVVFQNNANSKIQMIIEEKGQSINVILNPGEFRGIPFDFIHGMISIKIFEQGANYSAKLNILECICNTLTKGIIDIRCGEHYLSIKTTQTNLNIPFYTIHLEPPFSMKNCCPLPITYQLIYATSGEASNENKIKTLRTQEKLQETRFPRNSKIFIRVRMQNYTWSKETLIHSSDSKNISNYITLVDSNNKQINVYLHSKLTNKGAKNFYFYVKACIINETPYDLVFYSSESKEKKPGLIPGQKFLNSDEIVNKKIYISRELSHLSIGLNYDGKDISKIVNVNTIGSTAIQVPFPNNSIMELGINIATQACEKNLFIYTKIITISPRYIMINQTKNMILVKRESSEKAEVELTQDTRVPFQWYDWKSGSRHLISMKIIDKDKGPNYWNWSGGFQINTVGTYHILLESMNKLEYKYIKVVVGLEYQSLFITINEQDKLQASLKLRNNFDDMDIKVYQSYQDELSGLVIPKKSTIPFAWSLPKKDHCLCAIFYKDGEIIKIKGNPIFMFDKLNNVQRHLIAYKKNNIVKEIEIFITVTFEGRSKILSFSPYNILHVKSKETIDMSNNMHIDIKLSKIGISLISETKSQYILTRSELMYLLLNGVEFGIDKSISAISSQLRVKYFNIDNNISYKTLYPVLLRPTKAKDLLPPLSSSSSESSKELLETKNYFLDILVVQKIDEKDMKWFKTIKVLLTETTIKLEGTLIDVILELTKKINIYTQPKNERFMDLSIQQLIFAQTPISWKLSDNDYFIQKFQWKNKLTTYQDDHLLIEELVIHPLFVNLTFQLSKSKSTEVNQNFAVNLITNTIGNAIGNIDDGQIRLSGISMINIYDTKDSVINALVNRYKEEGKHVLFRLLGSMDLIGNPVGLLENISTGFKDLIEKPADGFLQGPLEGTKGLAIGAGLLLKNTVSGTFNSLGKITGSVASGFSSLTFDDEYLAQREKFKMKKPKHAVEGLREGAKSLVSGVLEGVAGVFLKPIEGGKKGGLSGLMKGTFQGITGLVAKPITGVLDAASKTSEGIKNTATFFDEKPIEDIRCRYPRAFYSKDRYYKMYIDTDAELLNYLNLTYDMEYVKYPLLSAFDIFPDEKNKDYWDIFALSTDGILYWNIERKGIDWEISYDNISKIEYNNFIKIIVNKKTSRIPDFQVILFNCDKLQNEFIYKKIIELKNAYLTKQF